MRSFEGFWPRPRSLFSHVTGKNKVHVDPSSLIKKSLEPCSGSAAIGCMYFLFVRGSTFLDSQFANLPIKIFTLLVKNKENQMLRRHSIGKSSRLSEREWFKAVHKIVSVALCTELGITWKTWGFEKHRVFFFSTTLSRILWLYTTNFLKNVFYCFLYFSKTRANWIKIVIYI